MIGLRTMHMAGPSPRPQKSFQAGRFLFVQPVEYTAKISKVVLENSVVNYASRHFNGSCTPVTPPEHAATRDVLEHK